MVERDNDLTPPIKFKKPDSKVADRKPYTWSYVLEILSDGQWVKYHKTVSEIAANANCDVLEGRKQPYRLKYKGKVTREYPKPE